MLPYMTGIILTVIAFRASRAACLKLGTERDSSTVGVLLDVTFGRAPRVTGNEAAYNPKLCP